MNKDITICFRTDSEIRNGLKKIAEEERQTISSIIEMALYTFLKEKKALHGVGQERRQYNRKPVSLPAFIMEKDMAVGGLKTGKVVDISLGGIRLCVPRGVKLEISTDSETEEIHIVFTLPEAMQPVNVKCKPQRIYESEDDLHIGASFVDADFQSYQALQKYLI
jgi:hypothetical protein